MERAAREPCGSELIDGDRISVRHNSPPKESRQTKNTDLAMVADEQAARDRPRIAVLLADDHKAMRQGLAYLLQSEPDIEVVGEADDGLQALELAAESAPR